MYSISCRQNIGKDYREPDLTVDGAPRRGKYSEGKKVYFAFSGIVFLI